MAVSKKKKPASSTKRKKPLNERHIIGFMFGVGIVLTMFLGVMLFALDQLNIPGIRDVSQYNPPQATLILDRYGSVVDRVAEQNRIVIGLDKMPPLLPKAFVAAEDGRFYEHPVDHRAVAIEDQGSLRRVVLRDIANTGDVELVEGKQHHPEKHGQNNTDPEHETDDMAFVQRFLSLC